MGYKIDLGCGSNKREGCLGIDIQNIPGVDYVVDLRVEPLPFPDQSVDYVYSRHFFEHIADPTPIFAEIGRVASSGAQLEFWNPYAFSGSAFIFDHKIFLNEEHYLHMCVKHVDFWKDILRSQWLLKEIRYIIEPAVLVDLQRNKHSLDFAIKYFKDVVLEFGVFIEVQRDYQGPILQPVRTWAVNEYSQPAPIEMDKVVSPTGAVIKFLLSGQTSRKVVRRLKALLK